VRKADGTVWAWGYDGYGQLGAGNPSVTNAPLQVPGLSGIADVGAAWYHSLAVTSTGVVYTWGENTFSQGGVGGDGSNISSPHSISEAGYNWRVGMPDFSGSQGGTFNNNVNVVVTEATPGATIYYTRDGTEPTEASSVVVSGATLVVDSTQILKAKAFKAGMPPSHTTTASYVLKPVAPSITPSGGTYSTPQNVTITQSTTGAVLRYTVDGSDPVETSPLYTGAFQVATTTTVKAAGFKPGWTRSDIRSATINMNFGTAPTATPSPAPGSYVGEVTVSLSTAIPGAIIRYTTNNTFVSTSSPIYSGPFTLVATTGVRSRVYHADYNTSSELVSTYTIETLPPVLSLPSGSYDPGTSVTVTAADPASTMRFTMDGLDPTTSSPILASGTSMIVGNYTLKVRAFKTGLAASPVTAATYTLTSAFSGGNVGFGSSHAVLATPDGRVFVWGDNALGLGTGVNFKGTPTLISSLTGVASVSAGASTSFAVMADGRLFAWGQNSVGQLGDGSTTFRSSPVQVVAIPPVKAVSGGNGFGLALTTSGEVYAWGSGSNGQLGNGGTGSSLVPVPVPGLSNVVAVAAGYYHAAALTADGRVYTWGYNADGRLGDGTTTQRNSPTLITAITGVASIAIGPEHTRALLHDGRLYNWGSNSSGQLGLGNTGSALVPMLVPGVSASLIGGGGFYNTMAVRADGAVVVTGSNNWLAIGDGTSTNRTSYTPATGISSAISVAGSRASVAVMSSGAIYTWGAGDTSQLGDGTATSRGTPTLIATIPGPWAPAAPTFSVAPGSYTGVVTVVVADATPGAVIRYTTDGSTPTEASPEVDASGEVLLASTTTLKARAFVSGRVPSPVTAGIYVVTP
jgi:YD repeat-containing protein